MNRGADFSRFNVYYSFRVFTIQIMWGDALHEVSKRNNLRERNNFGWQIISSCTTYFEKMKKSVDICN